MLFIFIILFLINNRSHVSCRYLKKKKILLMGNLEIEKCDLDYYNGANERYNEMRRWYESPRNERRLGDIHIPGQYLVHEDAQNVHDTLVVNSCQNIYKNIPKSIVNDHFFLEQFSDKHRDILERIRDRNSFVTRMNRGEWEVVKDVWTDSQAKPLVRDQYLKDLDDCLDEEGDLYCATGVVNRIISSSNIEEPEKMPKTKELYNQEIMNKFSLLMKESTKEEARKQINKEYEGILAEQKLNEIIDEWYEFV